MTQKKITITRDSVAIGDDVDAPHSKTIEVNDSDRIAQILKVIHNIGYLPKIAGGKATWSLVTNQPIAIIAQEWIEPRLIVFPEYPFQNLPGFYSIERLHFNYHAQENPEIVLRVLQRFRTIEE